MEVLDGRLQWITLFAEWMMCCPCPGSSVPRRDGGREDGLLCWQCRSTSSYIICRLNFFSCLRDKVLSCASLVRELEVPRDDGAQEAETPQH